jgi:very-short-patch-repair endonuclease
MSHLARPLRKNLTDAERWLWNHLRNRNLAGWKFRRQHPIGPFIVDFVCIEKKLIIEVDGGQHTKEAEADAKRTAFFEKEGYRVVRFWNHQVLQEGMAVLEEIIAILTKTPHHGLLPAEERETPQEKET